MQPAVRAALRLVCSGAGEGIGVAPGVLGPNEADTCRDFVIPKLEAAGWQDRFVEQFPITDGRIIPTRRGHRREAERLRADYLLEH